MGGNKMDNKTKTGWETPVFAILEVNEHTEMDVSGYYDGEWVS